MSQELRWLVFSLIKEYFHSYLKLINRQIDIDDCLQIIMNPHFLYLNWDESSPNKNLAFKSDRFSSVEVITSVGPYKNNYADCLLQKNKIYYWQIKIIQGNYFKIGIMKKSIIPELKSGAFSDNTNGYAYYSPGKLRNGSNSTGTDFSIGGYGPGDIVKVEFNAKKGILSFGKNKGPMEKAFEKDDFKKGDYVPAVSTLIEGTKYSLTLPDLED